MYCVDDEVTVLPFHRMMTCTHDTLLSSQISMADICLVPQVYNAERFVNTVTLAEWLFLQPSYRKYCFSFLHIH